MAYIGFDTSNYTTSVAAYDRVADTVTHRRRLLTVKPGEKGLRQSDAVFQHTQALPVLTSELFAQLREGCEAIGVSDKPCSREGSYMPCFTVGMCAAETAARCAGVKLYHFTHQQGHIAAALWSAGRTELFFRRFIAFHVSGGTTEAVLVSPNEETIFDCRLLAGSLDLKAGQAVDRVGLMLGLDFPCGRELDRLSRDSTVELKSLRPSMKGTDCSLSGIENKCAAMLQAGERREDIARTCIGYILSSLQKMTDGLLTQFGELPLVFSGGVTANSLMREVFTSRYGAVFAEPEFSSDNAAGIAVLTARKAAGKDR